MEEQVLWNYSLSHYALPGVADCCLRLQDDCGADVNLLLAAGWLASLGRPLEEALLGDLAEISERWQRQYLVPLREARCSLKPLDQGLYEQAKALELAVERKLQDALYERCQGLQGGRPAEGLVRANLESYLSSLGRSGWQADAELLIAGLEQ